MNVGSGMCVKLCYPVSCLSDIVPCPICFYVNLLYVPSDCSFRALLNCLCTLLTACITCQDFDITVTYARIESVFKLDQTTHMHAHSHPATPSQTSTYISKGE